MKKFLFKLSRRRFMGLPIGFILTYFPFLIPVKKTACNKKVVSFHHPAPAYPNHILLVPRKIVKTIFHLNAEDFFEIVTMAAKIYQDIDTNFTLLINGGERQDVVQAHFHLFTDDNGSKKLLNENGIGFLPDDKFFWGQIAGNLHTLLAQNGISENCFTMLAQFKKNTKPSLYFI